MMSIYHAPMLNDLHNYFPEILYNPGRFQTTQDLIQYIIQVANENPYLRGQAQYNYYQTLRHASASAALSPSISAPPPAYATATVSAPSLSSPLPAMQPAMQPPLQPSLQPSDRIYRTTTRISRFSSDDDRDFFNILFAPQGSSPVRGDNFVTTLLGQLLHGAPQTFLDPVIVSPSAEQIDEATTVETAIITQEDNCAICQEEIGMGQEMRTIDHCHHTFHQHCIDIWFQRNVRCPTCRHDIRDF
jgi:hypothetical protein